MSIIFMSSIDTDKERQKIMQQQKNFSENLLATERENNKYSIIYRFWHDYMEPKYEKKQY